MLSAEDSDVKMGPDKETDPNVKGNHVWMIFGRTNKTQSFALRDVPFKMEPITPEVNHQEDRSHHYHGVKGSQVVPLCHGQWHHVGEGRLSGS